MIKIVICCILCFIFGVVTGIPPKMGTLRISPSDQKDIYKIDLTMDLEKVKNRKVVRLDVMLDSQDLQGS